jgi:hypothetical protein
MTTVFEPKGTLLRAIEPAAANEDHLGYKAAFPRKHTDGSIADTGGWDAYEVWRRLIKDARDRRAGTAFPQS